MHNGASKKVPFLTSLRVAFFLAVRQVWRSSIWTNVLIIFIMTLTFLNLVVVSGILVGLVEGIVDAVHTHYLGDLYISDLDNRAYIQNTQDVIRLASGLPQVQAYTARYLSGGTLIADYKQTIPNLKPGEVLHVVPAVIAGIDPVREDQVTSLSHLVVDGQYLAPDDFDQVLLGASLLQKYMGVDTAAMPSLRDVGVGSVLRLTVNGHVREVTVKGIVRSKVDDIDRRIFMTSSELQTIAGRFDQNASEISLKLATGSDPIAVKQVFLDSGVGEYAKVQTPQDAQPKFVQDIENTFAILGNAISSIGLAVAAITVFIVIFISAITRRKFIGILKGVGITGRTLEYAYIMQSIFYAVVGTLIGSIIVFGLLKPYFDAHPIDFPFSNGILVATIPDTLARVGILLFATLVAGYIPARIVVRQNTLDAILGR